MKRIDAPIKKRRMPLPFASSYSETILIHAAEIISVQDSTDELSTTLMKIQTPEMHKIEDTENQATLGASEPKPFKLDSNDIPAN